MTRSIAQATAVAVIALSVAFIHNALSSNGIDPFKKRTLIPVVDDSVDIESEGIRIISLEHLRKVIDSGGAVIDARPAAEYDAGHVPGAIHLDYYEFGWQIDDVQPLLDYENELAIYCSGPLCEDSELLAKELYTLGYRNILVFRGGIEKWMEEGLLLEGDSLQGNEEENI